MTPASATPTLASAGQREIAALGASSIGTGAADEQLRDAWRKAAGTLNGLRRLERGWDGDTADPIDAEAIAAAERFMAELARAHIPAPNVVPLADGGVQLEWWRGERRLEIEFDADRDVVFVCDDPHLERGLDGQLPDDRDLLAAALHRTFAGS